MFLRPFCFACIVGLFAIRLPSRLAAADVPETDLGSPVAVNEAARRMTVPEGFRVSLFAGEPDLVQPIAMTTDERGRLWVIESMAYPTWTTNRVGSDRVVIFEDRNG